jgi:hypothetical protein
VFHYQVFLGMKKGIERTETEGFQNCTLSLKKVYYYPVPVCGAGYFVILLMDTVACTNA